MVTSILCEHQNTVRVESGLGQSLIRFLSGSSVTSRGYMGERLDTLDRALGKHVAETATIDNHGGLRCVVPQFAP